MSDVDLPNQSKLVTQDLSADVRRDMVERAKTDLLFFNKVVLGYKDMTLSCHGPLCVFLDSNPARFKLILYPRDHFKTTCGTIGRTMQRICIDSNRTQLIANESAGNAERMLRTIRQHSESNKLFRGLFSSVIPKNTRAIGLRWNDSELDFVRQRICPEPTVAAIGMTGAFTSQHYNDIMCDDPISEEALKSPKVMEDTISRFTGFLSLLVKPEEDTITLIGTRWALHDIYSWAKKHLGPELAILARSVYGLDGEPIFPELMSHELLALKRAALGDYRFSCLYKNNPRDENIQDLNVKDVKSWKWASADQEYISLIGRDGTSEKVVSRHSLDVTVTVDLAPAETTSSDMNAITTVGTTPDGDMVCLDAWGKRCPPSEVMEKLFALQRIWHPRIFGIEGVAYQKAFKYFLKDECERRMIYLNVKDIKAVGKKEYRIRGLQPIMQAGRFYMLPGQSLLYNQMSEFPLGEHDDVLDSLSMHLQLMTGMLSEEVIRSRQYKQEQAIAKILGRGEGDEVWDILNRTQETGSHVIR